MILILSLSLLLVVSYGAQISRVADVIRFRTSVVSLGGSPSFITNITANGDFYENRDGGHFRLRISLVQGSVALYAQSSCLYAYESQDYFSSQIAQTIISYNVNNLPLGFSVKDYFDVDASKYESGVDSHIVSFVLSLNPTKNMLTTNFTLSTVGCKKLRTSSPWSYAKRWLGGVVPTAADDVTLPVGSGVIVLGGNITLKSLTVFDATIVGHKTQCPGGWTTSIDGNKCYKLFERPLDFLSADNQCNNMGSGSVDRHLVHIKNRRELGEVYGLCRGNLTSLARRDGCWIGLMDKKGTGDYEYLVPQAVGGGVASGVGGGFVTVVSGGVTGGLPGIFLDWRRYEPSNQTISREQETMGGERCVATFPGQEDPLLLEQGGYVDDSCVYSRPYICQSFANTIRYTIQVVGGMTANGGVLQGGYLVLAGPTNVLSNFTVTTTATVFAAAGTTSVGKLQLEDGSILLVSAIVTLSASSFIGENMLNLPRDTTQMSKMVMQPQSVLQLTCPSSCSAMVNAHFIGMGFVTVGANAQLILQQGGEMSLAKLNTVGTSSQVIVDGYATRLSTYDAFELITKNRGAYQGEYRGFNTTKELSANVIGVFRLNVSTNTGSQLSMCIPYAASADTLASILNKLSIIQTRGGAVVRRYGDDASALYEFGYTYRIELPSLQTNLFALGPVNVAVGCYGIAQCGCAETLVPMADVTSMPGCPIRQNYSVVAIDVCNVPPILSTTRISTSSYLNTSGQGALVLRSGRHRLPPVSAISVSVTGTATGIVAADQMSWYGLQSRDLGQLIVTGLGWLGWDSAILLYAPDWTDQRGLVDILSLAPSCTFQATNFLISGLGSVLIAAPNASLTWQTGSWTGGIIGGMADLFITKQIYLNGTGKSLKYGLTMEVLASAEARWFAGNISLANGASIVMKGNLTVDNAGSLTALPMAIGEARYLQTSTDPAILIREEPGRSYQSYFSEELISNLRPGWYVNPLCTDRCNATNFLIFTDSGILQTVPQAAVTFLLPLELTGTSQLRVGRAANVTLSSGGTCGNSVIVDLDLQTTLILNGGQMEMQATCTIRGSGELIVEAGSHYLAFSIDAHITIAGGTLLWPESRGTKKTITFNGGLLLRGQGKLEVQPFSTTIIVKKEVKLTGDCLIQFPLIGIAAQASTFDSADAPDTSPRGNFTATDVMIWEGGTLKGKADFNILTALYLGGSNKYIQSLAKLVNIGHCEWGEGDIISSDNGDFQNFGTVQMRYGADKFSSNGLYKGTALPIENGGDVFALEFHTWDTDLGALNTEEYVRLTAQLVSRVPTGWTPEDQG